MRLPELPPDAIGATVYVGRDAERGRTYDRDEYERRFVLPFRRVGWPTLWELADAIFTEAVAWR